MSEQKKTFIVTFQVKELENRKRIREALKEYPSFCPLSNSSWAINTTESAAEVRDKLKTSLEEGDRLYVISTGGEAAWRNAISKTHSDWLKKFI